MDLKQTPVPEVDTHDVTTHEKKKKFHIWLFILLALPAILLIVMIVLLSLLLGPPTTYPPPSLPQTVMATQMKIYQNIYPQISKPELGKTATIVLSPQEINDLLIILRNFHVMAGDEFVSNVKPDSYDIRYQDKKFQLDYTYKYGKHNFNIHAKVIPGYKNNDLNIVPVAFKVGKLRLPQNILASNTSQAIKNLKSNPWYKTFEALVESITVMENGDIEIVYHPAKLKELIPPEVLNSKSSSPKAEKKE